MEDIKQNGCNDPFWPDGVNMNLKRNHTNDPETCGQLLERDPETWEEIT